MNTLQRLRDERARRSDADYLALVLERSEAEPDNVAVRIEAAYACDRSSRELEAIVHYDAAWRLGVPDPEQESFLVGYGSTLRNVGRTGEAVMLLRNAVATHAESAPLKLFLALAYHSAGENARALATMLDGVLEIARGRPLDGYERALAFYQRELLAEADRLEASPPNAG